MARVMVPVDFVETEAREYIREILLRSLDEFIVEYWETELTLETKESREG